MAGCNYLLVGHVDALVAGVSAVADRQEVDPVVAAAAPQPRHLKNIILNFVAHACLQPPLAAGKNDNTVIQCILMYM